MCNCGRALLQIGRLLGELEGYFYRADGFFWYSKNLSRKPSLYACAWKFTSVFQSLIGASLSEPHTSVTSLRTCVCIYACLFACLDRPLIGNFK